MTLFGAIAEAQVTVSNNRVGVATIAEAGDILAASGLLRIFGDLAVTEGSDTIIATNAAPNTGSVTLTEVDDAVISDGAALPDSFGMLDRIEEADSIAASGLNFPHISGTASLVEASDTIVSAGGASADLGDGTMSVVSTQTASGSASLQWTGLTAGTSWKIVGRLLVPATNSTGLLIQLGTGATPTWKTTGYDFGEQWFGSTNNGSGFGATNQSGHPVDDGTLSNTGSGVSFEIAILTDNASWVHFTGTATFQNTVATARALFSGTRGNIAAAITGFRLIMGSGNIATGNATLYSLPVA